MESKKRKKRKLNIWRFLLVLAVALFILGGLIGTATAYWMVRDAPEFNPKALETSASSIIYDNEGKEVAKIYGAENRTPVKYENIPPQLINAFLAIEDIRFFEHSGVDLRAVARMAVANLTDFKSQGGSTITQQLIKLTFLSPEKKVKRKVQEMYMAVQLENKYTKEEIIEMYLNRVFFGHNAYGIKAGAQAYFGKDLKDLTIGEMAMLAGAVQAPNRHSPIRNPEGAKVRQAMVLDNMVKYEFITLEEANKAKAEDFVVNTSGGNTSNSYPHQFFVEHVQDQLETMFSPEQVFEGGLRVYTTMDRKIQQTAETVMSDTNNFPRGLVDENGVIQPQAAAVVLDPASGHLKAIVGGRGQDQINSKRVLNRATQSRRQPGSTFKPIIAYAPAFERGLGPGSVVDDAPVEYPNYKPSNYDGKYNGLVSLRYAIADSINIVAVKLLEKNGITKSQALAHKMGISETSLSPTKDVGLGVALGGLTNGITPLEMAGAYGTFANKGVYVEPTAILKVEDRHGKVIYESNPKRELAMKPTTAYMITDILQTAVNSGTGTRAKLKNWPVAGKTGTTNESKDIWFAGYTPELVTVVWLGHDQPKAMPKQYGGNYPATIFKKIMTEAHEGLEPEKFEKPKDIVYATISRVSGKKPSPLTPDDYIVNEMFAKGTVPTEECDVFVEVGVSKASGKLASESCPDVEYKAFIRADASGVPMAGMAPTEVCTLHNAENLVSSIICTDPEHGENIYLANMPTETALGGCPPELMKQETFPKETAPNSYCPLPGHQLYPVAPTTGEPGEIPPTTGPQVPPVEGVEKPSGPDRAVQPQNWIRPIKRYLME